MQNLGGVFADLHPGAQHSAVEKTARPQRDGHIRFPGHQDAHPPATSGHPPEGGTQGQSRQEVGHRDADVARLLEAFEKLGQEGVPTPTRSAGQHPNAIRRARLRVLRVAPAQAREARGTLIRPLPHGLEAVLQCLDHRAGEPNADVTPSVPDAITQVFRSHIEASGDGQGLVDHQQLSVTADRQPAQGQWIEDPNLATGCPERVEETLVERRRTQAIDEHADGYAPLRRPDQGVPNRFARVAHRVDVGLQADRLACPFDRSDQGRKGLVARLEPLEGSLTHRCGPLHTSPGSSVPPQFNLQGHSVKTGSPFRDNLLLPPA